MKKIIATMVGFAVLGMTFTATRAFADDKEVTIKGSTKCSLCSLHEGKECTPVIQTKNDGKTVNYSVVDKDASKRLEKLCQSNKKVTVTGTAKEVDAKQKWTVT